MIEQVRAVRSYLHYYSLVIAVTILISLFMVCMSPFHDGTTVDHYSTGYRVDAAPRLAPQIPRVKVDVDMQWCSLKWPLQ